jgi:hypothetical protein
VNGKWQNGKIRPVESRRRLSGHAEKPKENMERDF